MRRVFAILLFAATLRADGPQRGHLVENVATESDATQTYTLYLPASYDAAKKYPLLLVFDPRGRGTQAAEIFREAAEEHGWIVISSNQTRSDGDGDANDRAVRALLAETRRYSSDPRRIYAAGFSGTAILACAVAYNGGQLAGVIGTGGRMISQLPPSRFPFAHFGAAGSVDFNNREMRLIDDELERAARPHRFVEFDGDHRWMPAEVAADALQWMEIVAMKDGRRPRDPAFVAAAYAADLSRAAQLERDGHLANALRLVLSILRTCHGLIPIDSARSVAGRLADDARVTRALEEERKWDAFETRYTSEVFARLPQLLGELRTVNPKPSAADVARALRVGDLRRHAKRDGEEGRAGSRLLEAVSAQASFYIPRQLFERGDYALAAAVLALATDLHPERWPAWYNLGAARARLGERKRALEALNRAVDAGFSDATALLADDDYASLRGDEKFQEIVTRLR